MISATMDLLSLLYYCLVIYVIVQFIRFLRADGDLTLLWCECFGNKPEDKLYKKVVWITGASSGIGEELAYQLAKLGAFLVLSARRVAELERVKQNCLDHSKLRVKDILVLLLDLNVSSSHKDATKSVIQYFGKIDILINNAGRSQRSLFLDTNLDVYEAIMHLNFLGTISLTKCVLPYMIKQEKGQIITVSSLAGLVAAPISTGYASSKHALQGFFNSLRPELANYPGIIISTVCPGLVHSNIVKNAFTEEINKPISDNSAQTCKMSTARCVQLMLVGMANELKEMWISGQPLLLYVYLWQYAPTLAWLVANKMSVKRIKNLKSGLDADVSYFGDLKIKAA
ncbi:dehydrogenase/reductase SDR family member 7 isoform X1 [Chiloscyllium plagiosum]|uniref:dehydrogenase/reductase SDR family member 7 isoform X1 n=1 Tax=Chiloscyllium plagiosum TaxID=36176 RepID=UPI001CB8203F|nr:dehydrogenase/reductase SDR family member 7 isoform X1 [Chiloscyllium plagiosum]